MNLSRPFKASEWTPEYSSGYLGHRNIVNGQWVYENEYDELKYRLIRICPLENGQFKAHVWDRHDEEYHEIDPQAACVLLAEINTKVEIAVPDLQDKHYHYESHPSHMRKI